MRQSLRWTIWFLLVASFLLASATLMGLSTTWAAGPEPDSEAECPYVSCYTAYYGCNSNPQICPPNHELRRTYCREIDPCANYVGPEWMKSEWCNMC